MSLENAYMDRVSGKAGKGTFWRNSILFSRYCLGKAAICGSSGSRGTVAIRTANNGICKTEARVKVGLGVAGQNVRESKEPTARPCVV